MKTIKQTGVGLAIFFLIFGAIGCGPGSYVTTSIQYTNPVWAPAYYPGVRYYYLPDIETYYDLSDQDFVYLDNGQWFFSPTLPSIYSSFNLSNCYAVALNVNVYRPWLHHQYYLAHYPRYYYQNVYHDNVAAIRGFNENVKKPIYWKQENHGTTVNNQNINEVSTRQSSGNTFNNSDRNRTNEYKDVQKQERKEVTQKPPQHTNYYGRKIGQPVRVRSWMTQNSSRKKRH